MEPAHFENCKRKESIGKLLISNEITLQSKAFEWALCLNYIEFNIEENKFEYWNKLNCYICEISNDRTRASRMTGVKR